MFGWPVKAHTFTSDRRGLPGRHMFLGPWGHDIVFSDLSLKIQTSYSNLAYILRPTLYIYIYTHPAPCYVVVADPTFATVLGSYFHPTWFVGKSGIVHFRRIDRNCPGAICSPRSCFCHNPARGPRPNAPIRCPRPRPTGHPPDQADQPASRPSGQPTIRLTYHGWSLFPSHDLSWESAGFSGLLFRCSVL